MKVHQQQQDVYSTFLFGILGTLGHLLSAHSQKLSFGICLDLALKAKHTIMLELGADAIKKLQNSNLRVCLGSCVKW